MDNLRLSDNVIARFVQILQEALMSGTDITDHLRAMRFVVDAEDCMQLSPGYMQQVERGYQQINQNMAELMNAKLSEKD